MISLPENPIFWLEFMKVKNPKNMKIGMEFDNGKKWS